jgi:hypothetical protein
MHPGENLFVHGPGVGRFDAPIAVAVKFVGAAGGVDARCLARWNGFVWSAFGTGFSGSSSPAR